MSNRKRIPERSYRTPQQPDGRGRQRRTSRTAGGLGTAPAKTRVRLIAAGALGSAAIGAMGSVAVMALPSGAANNVAAGATPVTAGSTGPATAKLTDNTTPANSGSPTGAANSGSPTGAIQPGGTGTLSATLCMLAGCLGHTTSQSSDGGFYNGYFGGWGAGGGLAVQATPEGPPPVGLHAGPQGGIGGDVTLGGVSIGASVEGKVDVMPYITGVQTASSFSGGLTFPGIATVATWLGYPQFQFANGIGVSYSLNAEGQPEWNVFPRLSGGEDAHMTLGIFSGTSTAGSPSSGSETGGSGQGDTAQTGGPFGGLTFDQMSSIPQISAGFDAPGTASAPYQAAQPGTTWPSLTQMMTVPSAQGQAVWPDGTPATVPSYGVPFPTAPVTPDQVPASPTVANNNDNTAVQQQQPVVAANDNTAEQQPVVAANDNTAVQQQQPVVANNNVNSSDSQQQVSAPAPVDVALNQDQVSYDPSLGT